MNSNPDWCGHPDCICLKPKAQCACVGRLPKPSDHGKYKEANTHRLCLRQSSEEDKPWYIDLMVNTSDVWQFMITLDIINRDAGKTPITDRPTEEAIKLLEKIEVAEMLRPDELRKEVAEYLEKYYFITGKVPPKEDCK